MLQRRQYQFTVLVDEALFEIVERLAQRLGVSRADAIRMLLRLGVDQQDKLDRLAAQVA